jgi:hypothetical protein
MTHDEHSIEAGHDFNRTSMVVKATAYKDHTMKEVIETQLHPINFNRNGGFTLSQASCASPRTCVILMPLSDTPADVNSTKAQVEKKVLPLGNSTRPRYMWLRR